MLWGAGGAEGNQQDGEIERVRRGRGPGISDVSPAHQTLLTSGFVFLFYVFFNT